MPKSKRFEVWAYLPADQAEPWQEAGSFSSMADADQFIRTKLKGADGVAKARVVDSKEEMAPREYNCVLSKAT